LFIFLPSILAILTIDILFFNLWAYFGTWNNLSGTDTRLIVGQLKQDGSSRERIEQDGGWVANITTKKSHQEWESVAGGR
jgi:hypothetical protein